jgi:hypothetical protein
MTAIRFLPLVAFGLMLGCARPHAPDYRTDAAAVDTLSQALGSAAAASGGSTKVVADPTGWATIKGRFRLSAPVTLTAIAVTKDQAVCGATAPNQAVDLGPDNSLRWVLVYLNTKLPSLEAPWVHPDYGATADDTVEFDQKKCIFLSHVFGMRSTQKLNVLNSDSVGHNTAIKAFGYDTIIPAGSSNSGATVKPLNEPAATACAIHPWMSAFIMATPHPYLAVTDENGEFEIKNIPAGIDLEFRIWQEQVKYVSGGTVNGANESWVKGRKKMKLENDQELVLDVVLDAEKFK